jgi:DNA mismatch endonuclease (patch repair protein)
MAKIRSVDTKPEMMVRRLVYGMGYRYRLHDRRLPGSPDMVFIGRRKVIFIHGCFWHRHSCKRGQSTPSTRKAFWEKKFTLNVERDCKNHAILKQNGWDVLILWECEIKISNMILLENWIRHFLDK